MLIPTSLGSIAPSSRGGEVIGDDLWPPPGVRGQHPVVEHEVDLGPRRQSVVHVPYKGDAPAVADLLAGQIHVMLLSGPALFPQIKAGRLRALAVTTEQRSPEMPDLPAIGELVPGYSHNAWNGMWAPAGTPREIILRLNQALARVLKQPEVQERLRADSREPAHTTPEEFGRVIARDVAKWSGVVKAGNIKVD
jgi:tripartite-type tricarboxylate transporter receptor subunit TctC